MGRWNIDGLPGPALCWPKACTLSHRVAASQSRDVFVEYIGRRDNPNDNPMTSNFIAHPDGTRDFKVDPTWKENHGR